MLEIAEKDKSWLISRTAEYFIEKRILFGVIPTIIMIILGFSFTPILSLRPSIIFLSTTPSVVVILYCFFAARQKKWQRRFLEYYIESFKKEKRSLEDIISKREELQRKAEKMHVLMIEFDPK
ncbi:hypothetical protein IT402_03050 [Candidatus Nomurabacteria bacterium]|nr:hypothetical protein [Candidatus Nomurabacteria bacterium]